MQFKSTRTFKKYMTPLALCLTFTSAVHVSNPRQAHAAVGIAVASVATAPGLAIAIAGGAATVTGALFTTSLVLACKGPLCMKGFLISVPIIALGLILLPADSQQPVAFEALPSDTQRRAEILNQLNITEDEATEYEAHLPALNEAIQELQGRIAEATQTAQAGSIDVNALQAQWDQLAHLIESPVTVRVAKTIAQISLQPAR